MNSDQDFASETNLKSKIVGSLKRLIFYRNTMIYNIENGIDVVWDIIIFFLQVKKVF